MHSSWIGVGAFCAALTALGACFYGPPINPAPSAADSPPFVLGFSPEIPIDLTEDGEQRFAIDAVYDLNDPEVITYRFLGKLQPNDVEEVAFRAGALQPREIQAFDGVTEYDGPALTLDRCVDPLEGADGDIVFVTLELTDELPASQAQDGLEEFVVTYTWRVKLTGACP